MPRSYEPRSRKVRSRVDGAEWHANREPVTLTRHLVTGEALNVDRSSVTSRETLPVPLP